MKRNNKPKDKSLKNKELEKGLPCKAPLNSSAEDFAGLELPFTEKPLTLVKTREGDTSWF